MVERTIERAAELLEESQDMLGSAQECLWTGQRTIHNEIRQNERSFDQAIRCLAEFKKLKKPASQSFCRCRAHGLLSQSETGCPSSIVM